MISLDTEKKFHPSYPLFSPQSYPRAIPLRCQTFPSSLLRPEAKRFWEINISSSTENIYSLGWLSKWLNLLHRHSYPLSQVNPPVPSTCAQFSLSIFTWVLAPRKCPFLLACQYCSLFPCNPYIHPYLALRLKNWCSCSLVFLDQATWSFWPLPRISVLEHWLLLLRQSFLVYLGLGSSLNCYYLLV